MTTPSHEHDDDLEPTVAEEEIEVEKYDPDEDAASDVVSSWTPGAPKPPAHENDEDRDADDADDRL